MTVWTIAGGIILAVLGLQLLKLLLALGLIVIGKSLQWLDDTLRGR